MCNDFDLIDYAMANNLRITIEPVADDIVNIEMSDKKYIKYTAKCNVTVSGENRAAVKECADFLRAKIENYLQKIENDFCESKNRAAIESFFKDNNPIMGTGAK